VGCRRWPAAHEDSPLAIIILIELLKRGDRIFPIDTATAGATVPNYKYKPFKPPQGKAPAAKAGVIRALPPGLKVPLLRGYPLEEFLTWRPSPIRKPRC
jgi:hypothetical protein